MKKNKMKTNKTTSKKEKKKHTILFTILGIIAAVIVVVAIVISTLANKNVKAMNHCVDAALTELNKHYTVTPVDTGEYKTLKLNAFMKFDVEQYDIEEIGNLSVMRVNMGFMQMATFVITPQDKNLPLLSADYMYILSNRKAYLEFYDVVKEKDEQYNGLLTALSDVIGNYEHLEDIVPSAAWYENLLTVTAYKAGKAKTDADLEGMLVNAIQTYAEQSKTFPALSDADRAEKLSITQKYTDGLIEKGGISTDVFKKELGAEETKKFFDNIFFGTAVN